MQRDKFIIYIALFISILLTGCADKYQLLQSKQKELHQEYRASSASIEYKILPQDRIKVILYRDPRQLSMDQAQKIGENLNPEGFLVNAHGYVDLPLIGSVKVEGLTQTQAAHRIQRLYAKEMTKPSVYVEIMNKRVYVLGEVKKPGVVKLDKEKMNLLEAIAFAGGMKDSAVRDSVVVVSADPIRGMRMRRVNLTDFDGMKYADLMLRPNDIVYVKPNRWKKFQVASEEYTSPFVALTRLLSPFVTLKALSK